MFAKINGQLLLYCFAWIKLKYITLCSNNTFVLTRQAHSIFVLKHTTSVYIYVWTFICHLYFDPSHIFMLARCLTLSQTSLNRILWFIVHYLYLSRNWIVYPLWILLWVRLKLKTYRIISIRVSGSGKLIAICHSYKLYNSIYLKIRCPVH